MHRYKSAQNEQILYCYIINPADKERILVFLNCLENSNRNFKHKKSIDLLKFG